MATTEQVADLRKLINEPDETGGYTDDILKTIIDENDSLSRAASFVWQEKAAKYAELVDTSEGNSSRALSKLYRQSLDMADRFDKSDDSSPLARATHIRSIERP